MSEKSYDLLGVPVACVGEARGPWRYIDTDTGGLRDRRVSVPGSWTALAVPVVPFSPEKA